VELALVDDLVPGETTAVTRSASLGWSSGEVGPSDVADLALLLHLGQRADQLGDGHLRVGSAELVQVDPVEPQPGQAALASLAQVLGPPVRCPAPGGPYSSRFTVRSPSTSIMPAAAAVTVAFIDVPL
jgi:hypothetical protein